MMDPEPESAPKMEANVGSVAPPSPNTHKGALKHRAKANYDDNLTLVAENIKALQNHIKPPVPNPAPLGLIAFGLTTALLQLKHTHIAEEGMDTMVMGFAMFFGGLLQVRMQRSMQSIRVMIM
jgi:hypothetical protein